MTGSATQPHDEVSFGPFCLIEGERLLTRDGEPVELGARAFDVLIALVSRPNEPVSKRELMAAVWPDVSVEEGSLRFHIAGLRKALGDGKNGARYITTLAGRGYCFVAPISRSSAHRNAVTDDAAPPRTNLPGRLARMVGREESVRALSDQLLATRFVTIVGAGGVGKTTVAVSVAHDLVERFAGAVLFADFGALSDPSLVPASIASMLGLSVGSDDPVPGLMSHLRDKRMLLVLDNCEHVIAAAAELAARIHPSAPQIHILATSREALRVEGEQVYQLSTLAFPPEDMALASIEALRFPATQLFVERAAASGASAEISESDAAIVADICRKLDGVPLAIELAAGRVAAFGLKQTADLLDQHLSLLWAGQRTAPPRQKTLQATLDWSYSLLTEMERVVLRRLAVFVGHFTIDAALAVVTDEAIDQAHLFGAIDSLVAKSMVATRPTGGMMRYRLLETTRAYALRLAVDETEQATLAERHATYYARWLKHTAAEWPAVSNPAERAPVLYGLANVRAALAWCFGASGNAALGVELAAAAAPVFLAMSLLAECHRWSERALIALGATAHAGREEMQLQAALGLSLMFTRGSRDEARAAMTRSLEIAEIRGEALDQLQVLGPLQMFHLRIADFKTAVQYGRRCKAIAATIDDPDALTLARSLLGVSLHLTGDLAEARIELEAALTNGPDCLRGSTDYLGFNGPNIASIVLARVLWLQGYPEQAIARARQAVRDAAALDHPVTLSIALIWAVSVFLWTGDLDDAEEHIERFLSRAESNSLGPYVAVGRGFQGELAIRRGDAKRGIEELQSCLQALHRARYEMLTAAFNISLAQGLASTGRHAESLALIDGTMELVEEHGALTYMPELLRVKGNVLRFGSDSMDDEAQSCFRHSLELSRQQGATAWELRAAVDLAALLADQGRRKESRATLQPVLDKFDEGLDTADLMAAQRLLVRLS